MYVRAGMTATIGSVAAGQYRMSFQIGSAWDYQAEQFRCVTATGTFDKVGSFEEQNKSDRIEYTGIRITLHKLIGGNARTTPLPRRAFRRRRTGA